MAKNKTVTKSFEVIYHEYWIKAEATITGNEYSITIRWASRQITEYWEVMILDKPITYVSDRIDKQVSLMLWL